MEALPHLTRGRPTPDWTRQWPRCVLLLQLTLSCAGNRRSQAGDRLLARIEAERYRMRGSPPLVEAMLNELWYAASLLVHGDRAAAIHHAEQARRKADRIQNLVAEVRCAEIRHRGSALRLRSRLLQEKVGRLVDRSRGLLARSREAQEQAVWVTGY